MSETLQAVKGMNDIFEDDAKYFRLIESKAREVVKSYGYEEIRTPLLEDIGLFVRSVGEGSDIVEKEMYTLEDRDGKELVLRPECTASVARALIERGRLSVEPEYKGYYIGPMFRRERPQRGRLRQFHQIGVEALGVAEPTMDVETMAMAYDLLTGLGLTGLPFMVNTLGLPDEKAAYTKVLEQYFSALESELCPDCKRRLHKNTLRILDCKVPHCAELTAKAPKLWDSLGTESKAHFEAVCAGLDKLKVPYNVAHRLVRGLDYYTRTVFEVVASSGLGSQNTVLAGGRYDGLIESLGGPSVPAFGFASGIERIMLMMQDAGISPPDESLDLVLVGADDKGRSGAFDLAMELRKQRVSVEIDLKGRSVKAQMRRADRLKARAVMVLGEREIEQGKAQLKWLASGHVEEIPLDAGVVKQKCAQN